MAIHVKKTRKRELMRFLKRLEGKAENQLTTHLFRKMQEYLDLHGFDKFAIFINTDYLKDCQFACSVDVIRSDVYDLVREKIKEIEGG